MADPFSVNRIAVDVASRIREADDKMHAADYAFAAGRFDEFFQDECNAAIQRVQDEYSRVTETGGGEAGGGGKPDAVVPEDG